jgi:hypothetical protein
MRGTTLALAFGVALAAPPARAEDGEPARWEPGQRTTSRVRGEIEAPEPGRITDGVYGRFDGDLELALGAGLELDQHASRAGLRLTLHYFSMLGIASSFYERVGGSGSERLFGVGVDLRPAFIPRWTENMQQGPAVLDLAIDSISLGLGAFWAKPEDGEFGDARGFELSGGLGLPLFGRAAGPWLEARVLGRWPESSARDSGRGEAIALLVLSWHLFVSTPLAGD